MDGYLYRPMIPVRPRIQYYLRLSRRRQVGAEFVGSSFALRLCSAVCTRNKRWSQDGNKGAVAPLDQPRRSLTLPYLSERHSLPYWRKIAFEFPMYQILPNAP